MVRGRPRVEEPRDRSLPEVRVTEREEAMIGLKAAVYTRGNVSALIREAVLKFISEPKCWPTVCVDCGVAMGPGEMEIERKGVKFSRVPAGQCSQCGVKAIDSRVIAVLEALAPKMDGPEVDVSALLGLLQRIELGVALPPAVHA